MTQNDKTDFDDKLDALVDKAVKSMPPDLMPSALLRARVLSDFDTVSQARQNVSRLEAGSGQFVRDGIDRLFGVSSQGAFAGLAASIGLGMVSAFIVQSAAQVTTLPQTPEALLLAELNEIEEAFGTEMINDEGGDDS